MLDGMERQAPVGKRERDAAQHVGTEIVLALPVTVGPEQEDQVHAAQGRADRRDRLAGRDGRGAAATLSCQRCNSAEKRSQAVQALE